MWHWNILSWIFGSRALRLPSLALGCVLVSSTPAEGLAPGTSATLPAKTTVIASLAAAAFFFTLWLMAWLRERGHLRSLQELRLRLMASEAEVERERAESTQARAALRTHAVRDSLTGLLNRTSILEALDREMARAVRDKSVLTVVLADIDHFSRINEAHGREAGDEVLRQMGARMEDAVRSYDTAGRYGGGEFLMLLPSFEGDTGVERLRRIHDSICGKVVPVAGVDLAVTCSFGVSLLLPNQFYSAEELLERAGQAMQTAKQDGRNRIGFFARSDV